MKVLRVRVRGREWLAIEVGTPLPVPAAAQPATRAEAEGEAAPKGIKGGATCSTERRWSPHVESFGFTQ